MPDKNAEARPETTLADEQITSQRGLPRRSFLTAAGAMLVGAAAVVASARAASASSLQGDPDAKKTPKKKTAKHQHAAKHAAKKGKKKPKASDPDSH
ncbi:MAG: hypothetical protein ACRD2H_13295 [Terriglobales bacterium]